MDFKNPQVNNVLNVAYIQGIIVNHVLHWQQFTPKKLLASFVSLVFEIKTVESAGYVGASSFM